MSQTPLGLIAPVNVALATLPQVRAGAGEIPILPGATLAPRSSGVQGQGEAIADIANSPITKSIQTLGQYMLDKFDPDKRAERQARKSLLDMQVKQGQMEMELAPQKFALEKEKLGQEVEQNKFANSLLNGKLGFQKDSFNQEVELKKESLKNEQQRLLIEAQKANSEQEKNDILKKGAEIQNQIDEMNLQTTKNLMPLVQGQDGSSVGNPDMSNLRFMSNPILKAMGQDAYDKKKDLIKQNQENKNLGFKEDVQDFYKRKTDADNAVNQLDYMETLNTKGITGPMAGRMPGYLKSPDIANFDAASKSFAQSLRAAGTGSMSDFDVKTLQAQSPTSTNTPAQNQAIIERLKVLKKRESELQDFVEQGIKNGVSPSESRKVFKQFANANKAFDENGSPIATPSIDEWLANGGAKKEPSKQEPTQDDKYEYKTVNGTTYRRLKK